MDIWLFCETNVCLTETKRGLSLLGYSISIVCFIKERKSPHLRCEKGRGKSHLILKKDRAGPNWILIVKSTEPNFQGPWLHYIELYLSCHTSERRSRFEKCLISEWYRRYVQWYRSFFYLVEKSILIEVKLDFKRNFQSSENKNYCWFIMGSTNTELIQSVLSANWYTLNKDQLKQFLSSCKLVVSIINRKIESMIR